eukprot:CAMPEP_0172570096 /NCGR_PEP_ID=MMETSP1067-20121228/126183_1 /TAXON_ID=265564 ORGANISM="Thalassiosira punctigera, Strain Tpunct2005C2" /NCGR_SAMPLE_ID=MMETSP1067 /ASSEMBLY_ACC=CAM_ASM_000444 /LENGTH=189 /DNA_ID=CAMNT_0013362105 /DNA_START=475 /DNA_END=1041 /DNA_ORIENTATION=+
MSVIEFSRLQVRLLPSLSRSGGEDTYERIVSVNTAQSSTAKNVGSFLAAIATFFFFSRNRGLGERAANTLLLGTAAIFLLASLASLKYQCHVGKMLVNFGTYDTIDDELSENSNIASSSGRGELEQVRLDDAESNTRSTANLVKGDLSQQKVHHRQQIMEVSTLISFQMLLAVSALQKPISAISNQTTW